MIEWIAGNLVAIGAAVRPLASRMRRSVCGAKDSRGSGIEAPFDIAVRAGEIVGVTGILGSGYSRICEWLCGLAAPDSGTVLVDERPIELGSPRRARDAGLEIVAGDRSRGAFPERTVRENLFADSVCRRNGRPDLAEEARQADATLVRFGVKPRDASELQMQSLSGGNQQKRSCSPGR